MKRFVLLVSILFILSGCAIGPRYERPAVLTPTNYRNYEGPTGNESIADVGWWDVFRDDALKKLIEEALKNNYDLQVASARVQEYRALYGYTRGKLLPEVDAAVGMSRQRNSLAMNPFVIDRTSSSYQDGFSLNWEVDVWGKIRRETEAAKARYLASDEARAGVLITLVADVATAYFNLREQDLELEIDRQTLQTRKDNVDLFSKRLSGGVASKLEVLQAQADLAETAAAIPDAERQIAIQENLLSSLLGKPPGPIARGLTLTEQYKAPGVPIGIPSQLLERRPDIRRAEQTLRAANAEVGVATGEFLPKFNLTSAVGNSSQKWDQWWDSRAFNWSVGGDAVQPIFHGGKIVETYKAAKARWEETLFDYQNSCVTAFREVADAIVETRKYREVIAEQEKAVAAYAEGSQLSRMRYENGLSSYLEVLDADRRLFNAQTQLAKIKGQQLNSIVKLYRALGGGWQVKGK